MTRAARRTPRRRWPPCLILLLAAAAGCARGVENGRLSADLQARLDRDVKPGLFELVALRRAGSAPLPDGESGAARVVIYFNATLRMGQDYGFGGWEQLSPASVAYALGATEKGLFGLRSENRAGDLVHAYGSAVYQRTTDGWAPTVTAPAPATAAPNIEGTAPPTRSKELIDRLASLVNLPPPGVSAVEDQIIAEELERAAENIERRVTRRGHVFTLATGPADGDYARFGEALIAAVGSVAPPVKLRQRHSAGSVENVWLLARGEADYALVQGDVAAAAVAGEGVFASGGALANLRAVGTIFPEVVHVAVLPDSPIRSIAELRGKRVDIGPPASGTRFDAVAVLAAYGLTPTDLGEAREEGPAQAIARLERRQIDAVFATAAAPMRLLQALAAGPGLRLLPLKDAALGQLVHTHPTLTPLTLPANTYLRQSNAVATVAAAALLVTTEDAPRAEVERVADLVYVQLARRRGGHGDFIVPAGNELRGVTIPLHPGAGRRAPAADR